MNWLRSYLDDCDNNRYCGVGMKGGGSKSAGWGGGWISEHRRGAIICYPGLNLVQDMIVSQSSTNHKQMFTYCWEIFPLLYWCFIWNRWAGWNFKSSSLSGLNEVSGYICIYTKTNINHLVQTIKTKNLSKRSILLC